MNHPRQRWVTQASTRISYKKRRYCAWDSNPETQDGRRIRIYWTMVDCQLLILSKHQSLVCVFAISSFSIKIGHWPLVTPMKVAFEAVPRPLGQSANPTYFCRWILTEHIIYLTLTTSHTKRWFSSETVQFRWFTQDNTHYAESTHLLCKGKYHCTADLMFDLLGFSCFAHVESDADLQVLSNPTGGHPYRDTFLYKVGECSLHCSASVLQFNWIGCLHSVDYLSYHLQ